jgi:hypothetical protein
MNEIGVVVRSLTNQTESTCDTTDRVFHRHEGDSGIVRWDKSGSTEAVNTWQVTWDADPSRCARGTRLSDMEVIGLEYHGYRFIISQ